MYDVRILNKDRTDLQYVSVLYAEVKFDPMNKTLVTGVRLALRQGMFTVETGSHVTIYRGENAIADYFVEEPTGGPQ